jgi:enterochelin esterase family protein
MPAQTFDEFLSKVSHAEDSAAANRLINEFMGGHNAPVVEKDQVHFLYRGRAEHVAVPSELNRWNPSVGMMKRIEGTDLFFRSESLPPNGRVEYKIWVDSSWMLDPLNHRTSPGGYGANSDVWMPAYHPSPLIAETPGVPRGAIDTLWIESAALHRRHPVFVYTPAGIKPGATYPSVIVTDGADYLGFARMNLVLDNLIAGNKIRPLIGIFVDPRTDLNDNATNHRMTDYAASDMFCQFLEKEVVPEVERRYPVSPSAKERVLLGASMGGLIATYAGLHLPEFFPNCAAQSPAYVQADSAVMKTIDALSAVSSRVYIQTGMLNDTQPEAKLVATLLRKKGGTVRYEEFPEGHNWKNWGSHLPKILQYFFPW